MTFVFSIRCQVVTAPNGHINFKNNGIEIGQVNMVNIVTLFEKIFCVILFVVLRSLVIQH